MSSSVQPAAVLALVLVSRLADSEAAASGNGFADDSEALATAGPAPDTAAGPGQLGPREQGIAKLRG